MFSSCKPFPSEPSAAKHTQLKFNKTDSVILNKSEPWVSSDCIMSVNFFKMIPLKTSDGVPLMSVILWEPHCESVSADKTVLSFFLFISPMFQAERNEYLVADFIM